MDVAVYYISWTRIKNDRFINQGNALTETVLLYSSIFWYLSLCQAIIKWYYHVNGQHAIQGSPF